MKKINKIILLVLSFFLGYKSINNFCLENISAMSKKIEAFTKINDLASHLGFNINNLVDQENYVVCYDFSNKTNNKKIILPFGILEDNILTFRAPKTDSYDLVNNTKEFIDINYIKKDASKAIAFVTAREIFNGIEKNEFGPDYKMTRAMFIQVLANLDNADLEFYKKASSFVDIKQDAWYSPAINWAMAKNLIDQQENNLFMPNDYITREDMAYMLYKYSQSKNFLLWQDGLLIARAPFYDLELISQEAREAVTRLNWAGIINAKSNNNFEPKEFLTRAETANIIKNFITRVTQVN